MPPPPRPPAPPSPGSVHDEAVLALPWLTPPPVPQLRTARSLLITIGALCGNVEDEGDAAGGTSKVVATTHGRNVGQLPTHPRLAHALLRAAAKGEAALAVAAAAAAVLEERDVLRGGSKAHGADLRTRVRSLLGREPDGAAVPAAWYRSSMSRDELQRAALKLSTDEAPRKPVPPGTEPQAHAATSSDDSREAWAERTGMLLASGYADMVAQRQPGKTNVWALSNGRGASFYSERETLVKEAEYLICVSLDGGDKRSARIRMAAPLTLEELREELRTTIRWEETVFLTSDGAVRARRA